MGVAAGVAEGHFAIHCTDSLTFVMSVSGPTCHMCSSVCRVGRTKSEPPHWTHKPCACVLQKGA